MPGSFRSIGYAIRRGVSRVRREPVTTASIACAIAACVAGIGLLRIASHNLDANRAAAASAPALVVYLEAGADPDRAEVIGAALADLQGTTAVEIVSPEHVKARLELALSDDSLSISELDPSFFPSTIEVSLLPGLHDAAALQPFIGRLKAMEGVDSVDVLSNHAERGALLLGSIRSATRLLSLFLAACAVFVVIVLIRSSAPTRSRERELLVRLGATHTFATLPDLVAGALRGMLGGICALAMLYGFFVSVGQAAGEGLAANLAIEPLVFLPGLEIVALPLLGAVLGAVGAAVADRSGITHG